MDILLTGIFIRVFCFNVPFTDNHGQLQSTSTMENLDLVYQETSDSKAQHIPGRLNVVADKLSRLGQTIQTEWFLLPLNMQLAPAQNILSCPRFNNKLPLFVSPVPDPLATAVDALSRPW